MKAKYPDLEGKPIFISGATRGIGRAIALSLAQQKSHIIFNYRGGKDAALQLEKEIKELGGQATSLAFDVTDFEALKSQLSDLMKNITIEGVINNAGISRDGLLLRLKPEEVDQVLATNLKATMMITSVLSRSLLKAGPKASIVNISSIVGLMGNAAQSVYAASKAGMIGFTKSVAKELAPKGVRCNVICPGFIETDMTKTLGEDIKTQYLESIPLKRWGQGEDIAQLVQFLLSGASSYMTGEVIKIDGGLYI